MQLLPLQLHNPAGEGIISIFTNTPNYEGVERVELAMFNCPEWGTEVQNIRLLASTSVPARSVVGTFSPNITSCDSLVKVFTHIKDLQMDHIITEPVIRLLFIPASGSNRTYLAEVGFYGDDSPETIVTAVTIPPTDTTMPPPPTMYTTALQPLDNTTTPPPDNNTPPPLDIAPSIPSSSPITAIAASIGCVVLLIVCLLAAVLILWRCYYVKHNNSHHPAVGEGHINTHSHPPPVTLCEETGQVYYSTTQEVVPQESNDTYSHIHHDTITGRGASKKSREDTVAEDMEMGGYSLLSYGGKPQEQDVGT